MTEPVYDEDAVNLGYLKKRLNVVLWENTDLSSFISQDIPIDEYDYYIIFAYRNPSQDKRTISTIVEKEHAAEIQYHDYYNSNVRSFTRLVSIPQDMAKISFGNCTINGTTNNAILIPYKIVGCKYN